MCSPWKYHYILRPLQPYGTWSMNIIRNMGGFILFRVHGVRACRQHDEETSERHVSASDVFIHERTCSLETWVNLGSLHSANRVTEYDVDTPLLIPFSIFLSSIRCISSEMPCSEYSNFPEKITGTYSGTQRTTSVWRFHTLLYKTYSPYIIVGLLSDA